MLFFPPIPFRISRGLTNSTDSMDEFLSSYKCVAEDSQLVHVVAVVSHPAQGLVQAIYF